jgi:hypothetical protein
MAIREKDELRTCGNWGLPGVIVAMLSTPVPSRNLLPARLDDMHLLSRRISLEAVSETPAFVYEIWSAHHDRVVCQRPGG